MPEAHAIKVCSKCGLHKPVSDFGVESRRKGGRRAYCRTCGWLALKSYRQRPHVAAARKLYTKPYHLAYNIERDFGITLADFNVLFDSQGRRCAICRKERQPGTRRFALDHDHTTGKIRGILCASCNQALGKFGDDEAGLLRALAYLRGEST